MWTVWDKKSEINGFSAEFILSRNSHLVNEETVFIKTVNGRVTQIEGKTILANVGIDATLSDEEFIAAYEVAINQPITEEPIHLDEISDSEALAIIRGEAE